MQANGDILLGWQRFAGFDDKPRDFYVRQTSRLEELIRDRAAEPAGMITYGRLCGWTLARVHARSGDRIAVAAYLGTGTRFDQAIADFAATYADQNVRDHAALAAAAASGRVQVAGKDSRINKSSRDSSYVRNALAERDEGLRGQRQRPIVSRRYGETGR